MSWPMDQTASTGRSRGFTAIELLAALAILAVLAAMAAPSFTPLIERWRVRQTAEGLKSTLYYARAEAIRRGGGVFIARLAHNANGCGPASGSDDWGCGWVVFVDANGNRRWDAGEEIRRFDTQPGITVMGPATGTAIGVDRWGGIHGLSALGFTIAPPTGIASPATLGVCMASGGRIRTIGQEEVPCV